MQLYKLSQAMENIALDIDAETGEISPETQAALDAVAIPREQKITDTACLIKTLEAEAEIVKREADALAARAKRLNARAEWLRQCLGQWMMPHEDVRDGRVKVTCAESVATKITDENLLPREFVEMVVTEKIRKAGILALLKEGADVPGAELETRRNVRIG